MAISNNKGKKSSDLDLGYSVRDKEHRLNILGVLQRCWRCL